MGHYVFAIDPGTYSCGIAMFANNQLVNTSVVVSKSASRQARLEEITSQVQRKFLEFTDSVEESVSDDYFTVVCEEPLLRGKSNNSMQRLLGAFEHMFAAVQYIAPTTVKKFMGHGTLDKLEVALSAGEMLKEDSEKEILAQAVSQEQWDATDAVAIGLCYIKTKGGK